MRIQAVYSEREKIGTVVGDGRIRIEAAIANQSVGISAVVTEFAVIEYLKAIFKSYADFRVDANVLAFTKAMFNMDHNFDVDSRLIAYVSGSDFSAVMGVDSANSSITLYNNGVSTEISMDIAVNSAVSAFTSSDFDLSMAMQKMESIVFHSIGQDFSIESEIRDAVMAVLKSISLTNVIENNMSITAVDQKYVSMANVATFDFSAAASVGNWRLLLDVDEFLLSGIDNMTMEELDVIIT